MGYLKIPNLVKDPTILAMREVYALEKIHGTSAHLDFKDGRVHFFSGGMAQGLFVSLFDEKSLLSTIAAGEFDFPEAFTIYGEAFGGKQQGMSLTYGKQARFLTFDVFVHGPEEWLSVPEAERLVHALKLGFVHYTRGPTEQSFIDGERDKPSHAAQEAGITATGEGVVLRPVFEVMMNGRVRLIAKHKRDDYTERTSKADTGWPSNKEEAVLAGQAVADEWVTPMRLEHVLQKVLVGGEELQHKHIGPTVEAMAEDVRIEAGASIEWTDAAAGAVKKKTVVMLKHLLKPRGT